MKELTEQELEQKLIDLSKEIMELFKNYSPYSSQNDYVELKNELHNHFRYLEFNDEIKWWMNSDKKYLHWRDFVFQTLEFSEAIAGHTQSFRRNFLDARKEIRELKEKGVEQVSSLESNLVQLNLNENQSAETAENWTNIHSKFNEELIQKWQDLGFTSQQCKEWVDISSPSQQFQEIQEPEFYAWLRDEVKITAEEILNDHNLDFEDLKEEFKQSQQQTQILQLTYDNK